MRRRNITNMSVKSLPKFINRHNYVYYMHFVLLVFHGMCRVPDGRMSSTEF